MSTLPVDILVTTQNGYLVLRQLVESILHRLDESEYRRLVIVDDYSSDPRHIEYLDYLAGRYQGRIQVHFPERGVVLPSRYDTEAKSAGVPRSLGHGGALNFGLQRTDAEHVLMMDADSVVLRPGLVRGAFACFARDEKIAAVSQLTGIIRGERVVRRAVDPGGPMPAYTWGYPNAVLMMIRTALLKENGLPWFINGGWAHMQFVRWLALRRLAFCNFDFFFDAYAMHLGSYTLRNYGRRNGQIGFAADAESYAGCHYRGTLYDSFGGYARLRLPQKEYMDHLERKYAAPFDEIQPHPQDEGLIDTRPDWKIPNPALRRYRAETRIHAGRARSTLDAQLLRPALLRQLRRLPEGPLAGELRQAYDSYVSSVSVPDMAASWPLAQLFLRLLQTGMFDSVLDLGSGFSSLVPRLWARHARRPLRAISIDDSPEWLERTRAYLASHGVDTGDMYDRDAATEQGLMRRDLKGRLVLYDYSSPGRRIDFLPLLPRFLEGDSIIIFDDVHKAWYRRALRLWARQNRVQLLSLRSVTTDALGRYAAIGWFRGSGSERALLQALQAPRARELRQHAVAEGALAMPPAQLQVSS